MTVSFVSSVRTVSTFNKFFYVKKCSVSFLSSTRSYSKSTRRKMDEVSLTLMCKQLAPPLCGGKYKGQAGKIGVIGGSLEYTGAPYFAAISALKVGADLVHVFCPKEAGSVIKSYSPELMVHPVLDDEDAVGKIEPWLDRLHVVLIGPGLGREEKTHAVFEAVIQMCRRMQKPLAIDADGLFFVARNPQIIKDYPSPGVILTPNVMEFARLLGSENPSSINTDSAANLFAELGKTVTILRKGTEDVIMDYERTVKISDGGSGRRCGGQGDLLGGALTTFFTWTLEHKIDADVPHDDRAILACYAACKLTRECNARAFKKCGRSMTCSDMIKEIHGVFEDYFEQK